MTDFAALSDAAAVALAIKMAAGTPHEQNAREHQWALEEVSYYDRDATNCLLAQLDREANPRRILITEAILPGLGLNGGRRVRASAIATGCVPAHCDELAQREVKHGHAGRACWVVVSAADWQVTLEGRFEELQLTEMLNEAADNGRAFPRPVITSTTPDAVEFLTTNGGTVYGFDD